jgi:prepilin-type processing-associated H-X9-DG protein
MIELLVVIAIIAVLAALLLPALNRAKEQSKRCVCLGHMKQIGVATLIMADDNNGWINGMNVALTTNNDTQIDVPYYWLYRITNYLRSDLLVKPNSTACPSRKGADGYPPYGANSAFVGWGYAPMRCLTEVTHASRIFLIAESYVWYPSSPTHFDYTCNGNVSVRHLTEGMNFIFVDGHSEWVKSDGQTPGFGSAWWKAREFDYEAKLWWPYNAWNFGGWWGE